MKIAVTVKIIYDPEVEPKVNKGTLDYKKTKRIIDPIDEASIAAAVNFKKIVPSVEVLVICASRESDKGFLRYALAMGANEVIFIKIASSDNILVDGLITAKVLRRTIVAEQFDLILVGRASSDNGSGFVGPALSTLLGWRQLYYVCGLLGEDAGQLKIRCKILNRTLIFLIKLPCVLVCEFEKSDKFVSLLDFMRSKNKNIRIKTLNKLNLIANSSVSVVNYAVPKRVRLVKSIDNVNNLMKTLFS
ncbi:Electron transfer flavoprotein small subunit [Candidatus Hodgkinia cicadicola]|uniref:Electron transfer flavoprotein small subunit n=1 Tax=Candidatus Hodgkinia cicadicola TaxID=573658 RepID=A0ABX4MHH0_9HYPH|nr:Electron transfer flavoprotein small subunit [Candidatus Hodgkinia cicadicola]